MVVRLASAAEYAAQVQKEQSWLPVVAPLLPLPISMPLKRGNPSLEYPFEWSIYTWIEGETATPESIDNLVGCAVTLAGFLNALYRIDTAGGPCAGPHNFYRGGSLAVYDTQMKEALMLLEDEIKANILKSMWEKAVNSVWNKAPVWVHGDVSAGNLLVKQGRLSAVIDFGCMAIGDPACDLVIAWTLFKGESRKAFHNSFYFDEPVWDRARGWALWKALITSTELIDATFSEKEKAASIIDEIIIEYQSQKENA